MDPELKAKWIAALRSGHYTQGQGALRIIADNSFCCLGVLADISGTGKWEEPTDTEKYRAFISSTEEMSCGILPPNLRRDLNLSREQQDILSEMNDNGQSFAEIADWIEENL